VNTSSPVLACPVCHNHFSHPGKDDGRNCDVFGYGLDFRFIPRDCNRASDVATCPDCMYSSLTEDFQRRVPGQASELVRSEKYVRIFSRYPDEERLSRGWLALVTLLNVRGINVRDLGIMSLKGSWVARELGHIETEAELLQKADRYLDDALRRGLTKGDPGMVMYLLGEINRRKGNYLRGREMLTFLGNNPRYRYPALLLTVLIEEEDSTPYWSHYAPDQMEKQSPRFKGLFPPLRSIPPGKIEFYPDELEDSAANSGEDDSTRY
jgi:uncharacterized protein (DUF2225 family)